MEWVSVKEKGLPEPDPSTDYFVHLDNGHLGYGHFNNDYGWDYNKKEFIKLEKLQWYLDFDAHGEGEVTHYMKVEYPENE